MPQDAQGDETDDGVLRAKIVSVELYGRGLVKITEEFAVRSLAGEWSTPRGTYEGRHQETRFLQTLQCSLRQQQDCYAGAGSLAVRNVLKRRAEGWRAMVDVRVSFGGPDGHSATIGARWASLDQTSTTRQSVHG